MVPWRTRWISALAISASVVIEMALADQLVTCSNDITWMDNASGDSPCTVAFFLMLQCTAEADFAVSPLNSSSRSYGNPLGGQWCTCNTVVYNLMSACAICQKGVPTDFDTWTDGCPNITQDYPRNALAESYKTPQWAYVNISKSGSFNLEAAQQVAGVDDKGWSAVQIVLPIVIGVTVAIIAGVIFYFYRRRLKRRYTQIAGAYPSRPNLISHQTHSLQNVHAQSQPHLPNSRTQIQQQNLHARPPYHHHASSSSSSSVGLHSFSRPSTANSNSSAAPTRKKSVAAVAWERAKLHAPRKLGGLLADRPTVLERKRGADWSIDIDPGEDGKYTDPWATDKDRARSSSASKEANASRTSLASMFNNRPTKSGHGRSESSLGLLANTSPDSASGLPLPRIQDSPDLNRERPVPGFAHGLISSISGLGLGLGLGRGRRPPPVAVVSGAPRRGFNVDDVDSTLSPTVLLDERQRERESHSFVLVEPEDALSGVAAEVVGAVPAGRRTSLNLAAIGGEPVMAPVLGSTPNPSQSSSGSGGSGSRSRSDATGATSVSGNGQNERRVDSVVLISRSPGQDFNSMASPISEETTGLGCAMDTISPVESENWPAAYTDISSVLSPSQRPIPLPPQPPPTSETNSNPNSPSPSRPGSGSPRPQSRIIIPPGPTNGSAQLLIPSSVRAAGGYAAHPTLLVPGAASSTSLNSPGILPNTRLFHNVRSDSLIPEPPSAISNATAHAGSDHSSSEAYTVPNPFIFDARHGGGTSAAQALRLASPPRTARREGEENTNPFRDTRNSSFDLAG